MASTDPVPEVSIVIPTCNRRELLEACIDGLVALDFPNDRFEILVYDNGSSDGTAQWLGEAHPGVRVLSASANEGFAGPCNRLAQAAAASYVCFLNNDVLVDAEFLTELLAVRERTQAACVGARVLSADGARIEFDGGGMNFLGHGVPLRNGVDAQPHAAAREPFDTLFACGAAMLVDREVFLAVGGFDEDYFAYFEDVDLGWRLWNLGERCVVAPSARVRHLEHGSEALLPEGRRLALLERNALLSVVKNYEQARAQRVLRCALALLAERAECAPDAVRRRACREGLLMAAPALRRAEANAQALGSRRTRFDAEVAPLFMEPWRPPIAGEGYARRQFEAARQFGAADLFEAPADFVEGEGRVSCI